MACPFFMPVERADEIGWIHAPRLPLGDRYRGWCQSRPGERFEAEGDLCNCGYARGLCDRFPSESPGDAVRFSTIADYPGRLRLVYIVERSHAPAEHGSFEYPSELPIGNERLMAQARAFAESHLRRRQS